MFYFGSWIESLVHHNGVSIEMGVASSEWTRTDVFPRLTLLFNESWAQPTGWAIYSQGESSCLGLSLSQTHQKVCLQVTLNPVQWTMKINHYR